MKVLSLGLGVQSTWIYIASTIGLLPKLDAAIFADTGKEKAATLHYLEWLREWANNKNAAPITVIEDKNLYKDLLSNTNTRGKRFASIPAFTKNEDGSIGMLKRQCTYDYKIQQIDNAIRTMNGLQPGQHMKKTVEIWKGISLDEIDRMSIPAEKWKIHIYPFCGYNVPSNGQAFKTEYNYKKTRTDIISEFNKYNIPIPPKSSCVFCPYQSDKAWYNMKTLAPEDFKAAIQVDEAIRNSTMKGINSPIYLHDSCKPLKDVDFSNFAVDLWKGECSGTCHT